MDDELTAVVAELERLAKALERARSMMRIVSDAAEDEGDRTYFGSSNHADWLREQADETEAVLFGITRAANPATILTGSETNAR